MDNTTTDLKGNRAWKFQDFAAHGGNVNCLALGHKSGRVLVTGGDDKKVNLWAVGKEKCIMSLNGHAAPIACVKFGHGEDWVCAGSQAGVVKLWDLEAIKLVQTLTSHKSAIRCIHFHPCGYSLVATGSLDTSIKLWDFRQKNCIFTYKGHQQAVNNLKFSPDGQWIASGGAEGSVKIWDLRIGRVFKESCAQSAAITDVEFHPHEFLLAYSTSNQWLYFWDLESFQLVSSIDNESSSITCLQFSADGKCLFGGCKEELKVYGWEPARVFDSVTCGCGKIRDVASNKTQLIGASFSAQNVFICVFDLQKLCTVPSETSSTKNNNFSRNQAMRKSFNKPTAVKSKPKSSEVKTIVECEGDAVYEVISEVANYETVFKARKTLNRSPPYFDEPYVSIDDLSKPSLECLPKVTSDVPNIVHCSSAPTASTVSKYSPNLDNLRTKSKPEPASIPPVANYDAVLKARETVIRNQHPPSEISTFHNGKSSLSEKLKSGGKPTELANLKGVGIGEDNVSENSGRNVANVTSTSSFQTSTSFSSSRCSTIRSDEETCSEKEDAFNIRDFLPKNVRKTGMSDKETMAFIASHHDAIVMMLKNRRQHLQIIYSLWHNNDLKCALEEAVSTEDKAVIVDVLSAINLRTSLWNLDICVIILPAILDLLQSKYEQYVKVACQSLRLIIRNFLPLIRSNIAWSAPTFGVDIPKEERYGKCVKCNECLVEIGAFLTKRQAMPGNLGSTIRDLLTMLQANQML